MPKTKSDKPNTMKTNAIPRLSAILTREGLSLSGAALLVSIGETDGQSYAQVAHQIQQPQPQVEALASKLAELLLISIGVRESERVVEMSLTGRGRTVVARLDQAAGDGSKEIPTSTTKEDPSKPAKARGKNG